MMIRTDIVYMIGHSNLPIEVFLSHLKHYRIEKVIDVRSVPRSRWHPQFNREPLRASLEQRRIGYQSLPTLGGRPALAGQALEDEIAKLLPPHERTCWMCSEGDPHQCHRRSLLEPVILGLGCAVRQILPDGSLEEGPSSRVG